MQRLTTLLERYAQQSEARWWSGPRAGQTASDVAARVGYPTATHDLFAADGLLRLDRARAAHVLAVAGTTSLAHSDCTPDPGEVAACAEALRDLAEDAIFLSNGTWHPGAPIEWTSLTSATFDCGLIGYDRDKAFIFWIEEED